MRRGRRVLAVAAAAALALAVTGSTASFATAAPGAGPETRKCAPIKQGIGGLSGAAKAAKLRKFNACVAQNKANRIAFNQIKDSRFTGTRGDGNGIEDIYCANGKFESRTSGSYGTGVSSGTGWRIADAVVKRGGKWIDAVVKTGDSGEMGLLRRDAQWQVAVASLGRFLYPGDVVKANAAAECAKL